MTDAPDEPERIRPRRRWYALPAGLLLGSLGIGSLAFWLVVRPLLHGDSGSPLRVLVAFVVLVVVVAAGFLASFLAGLVIAVRRSRARRGLTE
jgi:hypothetical protein